jgi:hypothetical protein
MVVERFTVVVLELMIALPRALWREVVWSGNHTRAAYPSFQGECGHAQTTTLVAVHAETGGSGPAPWIRCWERSKSINPALIPATSSLAG